MECGDEPCEALAKQGDLAALDRTGTSANEGANQRGVCAPTASVLDAALHKARGGCECLL